MKIVVTSQGGSLESPVDMRFGRAAWFILYDSETGGLEVHENTSGAGASQGAGVQAAERISQLGADVVITGHCGPKAFRTLRAAGIRVALCSEGTVAEALDRFESGRLEFTETPDVEGHW